MLVYVSLAAGAVIALLAIIFLRPIAALMGAEGTLLEDCVTYGRILLAGVRRLPRLHHALCPLEDG